MQLLKLDANGLGLQVMAIPAGYVVTDDMGQVSENGQRLALVKGKITRVWDLRGFSCFGGGDGRTPGTVPNDSTLVGKSWDDLAKLGYRQAPLPLSADELAAQKRKDAAAAAQVAAAATARLTVRKYQLKIALMNVALLDKWQAAINESPDPTLKIVWADEVSFGRSMPFIATVGDLLKQTSDQLDTLFQSASKIG